MFKSVISRFAAAGAVIAAAAAIVAPSASASGPLGLFCPRGAQISVMGDTAGALGTVHGTCFTPGDSVDLWFWGNGNIVGESVTVSSGGTFSAPVEYVGVGSTESAEAFDFSAGIHSNTVTFGEPSDG
jgi:hypothetical protein